MSIKFPDFQVLVARSDQVPRINREGDQTGAAGKLTPQITQEFENRQQRVDSSQSKDRVRRRKEREGRQQGQEKESGQNKKRQSKGRRRIDLRA